MVRAPKSRDFHSRVRKRRSIPDIRNFGLNEKSSGSAHRRALEAVQEQQIRIVIEQRDADRVAIEQWRTGQAVGVAEPAEKDRARFGLGVQLQRGVFGQLDDAGAASSEASMRTGQLACYNSGQITCSQQAAPRGLSVREPLNNG
jgi:hypothetical protein